MIVQSFSAMDEETRTLHLEKRHPGITGEEAHRAAHTGYTNHEHERTYQDARNESAIRPGREYTREERLALGYSSSGEQPRRLTTGQRELLNWRGWVSH